MEVSPGCQLYAGDACRDWISRRKTAPRRLKDAIPPGGLYIAGDKDAQVLGSKTGWRENGRGKTLWGGDGFN